MSPSRGDEVWMRRALELAWRGRFTTWPNPMVGCVVVQNDTLLAEGWHATYGEAHAEVNALSQLPNDADLADATVYVTLEPCSHVGKTPPCADLLVTRKPGRVVVATTDPNPKVSGRGIQRLRDAGLAVEVGCLQGEADRLNRAFIHAMTNPRPWITLKWAQSADGFMDPDAQATWGRGGRALTGPQSARHSHGLRARHDGILVGMRTWLVDRPALTTRHVPGRDPLPFVLTSGSSAFMEGAPQGIPGFATLLCPVNQLQSDAMASWKAAGYRILGVEGTVFSQEWWTSFQTATNVSACMVEGGALVARGVLESGCWDEVHVLQANIALHGGLTAPQLPNSAPQQEQMLGGDVLRVWRQKPTHTPC
jgi:diaminohydroxyphosphoribosylaminopyrimidine deaminase/5-amino-6-(5-phosphoribosylamino)uracil reductase